MFRFLLAGTLVLALAAGAPAQVSVQAGPGGTQVQVDTPAARVDVQAGPGGVHVAAPGGVVVAAPAPAPSPYWIGVSCRPIAAPMRTHLGLPDDQGLLVEQVIADSPAAAAGLAQHDVLLTAGGVPLGELTDLGQAVEAAQDGVLPIELIRAGARMTVNVAPAKRPAQAQPAVPWVAPGPNEWQQAWRQWLEGLHQGRPWVGTWVGPGIILPPGATVEPALPAGVEVSIQRQANQPDKIIVRRGDEIWEVTEDQIDQLPEDIRPHVQRMFGRLPAHRIQPLPHPGAFRFQFGWGAAPDAEPEREIQPVPAPASPRDRVKRQLEDLRQRMQELERSLDEVEPRRAPQS